MIGAVTVLPCLINVVSMSFFRVAFLLSNNDINEKPSSSEQGVKSRNFTGPLCEILLLGRYLKFFVKHTNGVCHFNTYIGKIFIHDVCNAYWFLQYFSFVCQQFRKGGYFFSFYLKLIHELFSKFFLGHFYLM